MNSDNYKKMSFRWALKMISGVVTLWVVLQFRKAGAAGVK